MSTELKKPLSTSKQNRQTFDEWFPEKNRIYGLPQTKKTRKPEPRNESSNSKLSSPRKEVKSPSPPLSLSPRISELKQTIQSICVGETSTQIKMVPLWFEEEDRQAPLNGIVYPPGITDSSPFNSIARYRALINKTNNFRSKPVEVNTSATETMVLALHSFAQQFSGDLSFTKKNLSFIESVERTACGIANLGSAHLLATNHIPTAKYAFQTTLNYKKDLAKSGDTMKIFVLSFASAIAEILNYPSEYIRVLAVQKNDDDGGNAKVDFGITTPDQIQTQILAKYLEDHARSGFQGNSTLKSVRADRYQRQWRPLLLYLQLRPQDFVPEHNLDYKKSGVRQMATRGGYPYYLPIGWYRHAPDVGTKYPGDQRWLDYQLIEGVWPVAFHGTLPDVVYNITKDGLSTEKVKRDFFREEAVQKVGSKVDKPGLYLATRCSGGAHPFYTKTFPVFVTENKTERFRVVFQCRVKPGEFTVHQCPITGVETWRVVDPTAIRPYGILVRRRNPPNKEGDESQHD